MWQFLYFIQLPVVAKNLAAGRGDGGPERLGGDAGGDGPDAAVGQGGHQAGPERRLRDRVVALVRLPFFRRPPGKRSVYEKAASPQKV